MHRSTARRQIALGKIDIAAALSSTSAIDVPAQYTPNDGGAARSLVCSLPRDSFVALASSSINKQATIPFDKISLSCKVTNGAVFVQYSNQRLTISLDVSLSGGVGWGGGRFFSRA